MGEFRRASNEFRMQMEDELHIAEQADQQKNRRNASRRAVTPALPETTTEVSPTATGESSDEIMHENTIAPPDGESSNNEPIPIATSGDINLMPPAPGSPNPAQP